MGGLGRSRGLGGEMIETIVRLGGISSKRTKSKKSRQNFCREFLPQKFQIFFGQKWTTRNPQLHPYNYLTPSSSRFIIHTTIHPLALKTPHHRYQHPTPPKHMPAISNSVAKPSPIREIKKLDNGKRRFVHC